MSKEHMDDVFGIKLKTFDDKAVFEQIVKVKGFDQNNGLGREYGVQ
jgi:hypothetical protein